jgi:hypothetical protein
MASYLMPMMELVGVGPEARLVDESLFDQGGTLRDYAALSEELGEMQAFLGLLELELRTRLRVPHARGYPPRVFISYRRESPDDIAWCLRLARELDELGYEVLLDERMLGPAAADRNELARFVGLIADADLAVVVVTDAFLHHEGQTNAMRDWIFEEWSRITTLVDWGLLETVIVHRSGEMNGGIFGGVGDRSTYIDLREDPSSPEPVAEFFGAWRGRRLSPQDRARLGEGAAAAVSLTVGGEPDPQGARRAFDSIQDLAGTEEHAVAEVHVLASEGDLGAAARLALDTMNRNPTLPGAVLLGNLLWLKDIERAAFIVFAPLSEGPSLWRHLMRIDMAMILEGEGLLESAVNQFQWCLKAKGSRDLGGFWSAFGPAGIAECEARLEALSVEVGQGPATGCSSCGARFPEEWHACVYCGTTRPAGEACGMCIGDPPLMSDPGELEFCPVCRRTDSGKNSYVVPRKPGGAWSPLAWSEAT